MVSVQHWDSSSFARIAAHSHRFADARRLDMRRCSISPDNVACGFSRISHTEQSFLSADCSRQPRFTTLAATEGQQHREVGCQRRAITQPRAWSPLFNIFTLTHAGVFGPWTSTRGRSYEQPVFSRLSYWHSSCFHCRRAQPRCKDGRGLSDIEYGRGIGRV